MSDMTDDFAAMKAHRQQQHADWKQKNTALLRDTLLDGGRHLLFTITNYGETLCFRESGKPKIDFYPSTGRWRIVGANGKTFKGGAESFLRWYEKQKV